MTDASTDPCLWSLTKAADAVASGKISSRELTEALLARIEKWQPVINCFIHLEADLALAMADAADAARARGAAGRTALVASVAIPSGHCTACPWRIRICFTARACFPPAAAPSAGTSGRIIPPPSWRGWMRRGTSISAA